MNYTLRPICNTQPLRPLSRPRQSEAQDAVKEHGRGESESGHLARGELENHLFEHDQQDGYHGEAAVVELGVLLGDEVLRAELVDGPRAGREGGARHDDVVIDLLDLLELEVGAAGRADGAGGLLEVLERPRLERADREEGAEEGDEAARLLEGVLEGENGKL